MTVKVFFTAVIQLLSVYFFPTYGSRFLVTLVHLNFEGCDPVNRLYYCNLDTLPQGIEGFKGKEEMLPFQKLIDNFEAEYSLVANDDTIFTFRTNKNAPRYKLVRVDLRYPESWSDVVPESDKDVLESAVSVNGNQIKERWLVRGP